MSSQSSDECGRNFIHLVSVDGPNPNISINNQKYKHQIPQTAQPDRVTDYSKTEPNDDFFRMVIKDKVINNILEP